MAPSPLLSPPPAHLNPTGSATYNLSTLFETRSEDKHREAVCNILEEAISPAITTSDDYSVREKLKEIPSLGSWGFHVRVFEYCCSQFEGNDEQPFSGRGGQWLWRWMDDVDEGSEEVCRDPECARAVCLFEGTGQSSTLGAEPP